MNKIVFKSFIISIFILNPIISFAQKDSVFIKRIPHQISVEFGYRNSFYQNTYLSNIGTYIGDPSNTLSQTLNNATHGVGILVDYAWQLGGFNNKKPAIYLSIPMGYTVMFPDNSASKRVSMLNYGWTIRHNLATSDKKLIPFVGYGLFLNNMSLGIPEWGSVSGHQTQFEGGLNFSTATKLQYFVKLQGSYSSYPKLGYAKSLHFMYADLRFGVRL